MCIYIYTFIYIYILPKLDVMMCRDSLPICTPHGCRKASQQLDALGMRAHQKYKRFRNGNVSLWIFMDFLMSVDFALLPPKINGMSCPASPRQMRKQGGARLFLSRLRALQKFGWPSRLGFKRHSWQGSASQDDAQLPSCLETTPRTRLQHSIPQDAEQFHFPNGGIVEASVAWHCDPIHQVN